MYKTHAIRIALALLAATALGACTTATPYQPYRPHSAGGIHGGYSEQRLAPDRYLVRFHGNSLTSRDRVEGYMLYRSAELTLREGYDWFLMVDRSTEHNVRTVVQPDPLYRPWYGPGYGYWQPDWRYYVPGVGWNSWRGGSRFSTDRVDVRRIEAFETSAEIVMRKGPITANEPRAIDARKVLTDLGPTIERPKG